MGLFDMVMIKDNHISAAGGVSKALESVDQYLEQNKLQMGVEVGPTNLWIKSRLHRANFLITVL